MSYHKKRGAGMYFRPVKGHVHWTPQLRRINVMLDEEDMLKVRKMAEELDVPLSFVAREMILDCLDRGFQLAWTKNETDHTKTI